VGRKNKSKSARKKSLKPRNAAARNFFTSGLSRKAHVIKPKSVYDRRKAKRELREAEGR